MMGSFIRFHYMLCLEVHPLHRRRTVACKYHDQQFHLDLKITSHLHAGKWIVS